MKLTQLSILNYRSINKLEVSFPTYYSAICGKNDSGKTNLVRSIRTVFGVDSSPFSTDDGLSFKRDFPSWKKQEDKSQQISITAICEVDANRDAGLHLFLVDYLKLSAVDTLALKLTSSCSISEPEGSVSVTIGENSLTPIQSQEVVNKLQSIRALMFHNSPEPLPPYFRDSNFDLLGEISGPSRDSLETAKKKLNNAITKMVKEQQRGLSEILGRLKDKYRVGISVPEVNPSHVPLAITLGDDAVELDRWGSGTQNRTKTLLTLFRAQRLSESKTSASKITPIVIVEEPESFLHPAAQAEFGRMLQDLANEFKVQVLVSTHSPYMLSCQNPQSNLLIQRRMAERGRLRESELVDTSSEKWMEPFGLALGLSNEEFEPWRKVLFRSSEAVILVEGQSDVEYFS